MGFQFLNNLDKLFVAPVPGPVQAVVDFHV